MSHLSARFFLITGFIAIALGTLYLAQARKADAAAPTSLANPAPARILRSAPALTATPTSTPCPMNYSFTRSTGGVIDPGTTLVTGTQCDDCDAQVSLPFTYTLYDRAFTSINVSSNGVVAFGGDDQTFFNTCLPDQNVNYAIFPLWNDWNMDNTNATCDGYPGGNCGIFTSVTGSAPNRVFNVEWRAASFDHPIPVNFEMRLFEGQTRYEVIYASLDPAPGHTDTATVATQKDTGSVVNLVQCPDAPGTIAPATKLSFQLNNSCWTPTPTATSTISPTPSNTPVPPTATPIQTTAPTATPSPTAIPVVLRGHVTLQARPSPPNARWVTTISGSVRPSVGGGNSFNYQTTTDASGYFTVTLPVRPSDYQWRVKDPQTLANAGSATLVPGVNNVEMGTLREGDANNDNCVTITDFAILRGTYGKSLGDSGYDARADFNADTTINVTDFTLLKAQTGQCGAGPLLP